ncbi:hypothetical protein WJX82_002494 [Trebouxia sp. C0006]
MEHDALLAVPEGVVVISDSRRRSRLTGEDSEEQSREPAVLSSNIVMKPCKPSSASSTRRYMARNVRHGF